MQNKYERTKNTMMTEIAQKSYKDLFPLWFLKKKGYIEINNTKKNTQKKD